MTSNSQKSLKNNILVFFDVLVTCLIFWLLYRFASGSWKISKDYLTLLFCTIALWPYLLKRLDITKIYKTNPHSFILGRYMLAMICGLLGLVFLAFILKLNIQRFFIIEFLCVDFAILYILIIAIYHIAKSQRQKGLYTSNIFIIGDKNIGAFIHKIETNSYWGYKIKGLVSENPEIFEKYHDQYNIYNLSELKEKLIAEPIDEVFYCLPTLDSKLISDLVYICLELGITLRVSSQVLSLASAKAKVYYLGETPFFTFQNTPKQSLDILYKTILDKVFSLFAIIALSPVFLIVAIAIKLDSKGPVFFKQTRSGLRGRTFTLYKFRSMCENAEELKESLMDENEQEGPVFKIKNDKRITRVGHFIRKTSIDELPQFFNVLKGDMSIVGPRPPLPSEVKEYKPWQTRKLSMKPGLTCIWQVSGRNNIPFEQWMKLDLQYIDTWSLSLDLMIILKTIRVIIQHEGQ
ncbi:MAG: sugar transferase [Bacteroidales bacterium]|nr:sugar transferase [Bacteroidales bacterium]